MLTITTMVVVSSCGSGVDTPAGSGSTRSGGAGGVPTPTVDEIPPATDGVVAGRGRLTGLKEVTVTITDADGGTRTVCLLLADTDAARERGLMFVTDPALGGYDGMLFAFPNDTDGGFWMKNTKLPLSIAYLRADGSTVSTTDMEPCPSSTRSCPVYPAGGDYRYAIEVPKGRLDDLGVSDRSRVSVGPSSCPAPGSTGTATRS